MLFWILALAITVVSTVAVLRPLLRRTETLRDDPPDVAVYKDQLRALDADVERGVIAEDEAATSRAEIGRRLLAAADRPSDHDAPAPARLSAFTALAAAVLVLAGGVGLYINLGAPGLPDQPLASRDFVTNRLSQLDREAEVADQIRAEERTPEGRDAELLAQLRETLEDRPNDPVGHRILARTLTTFGAFVEAREAQTRAIEILGDEATSDDFASLAEIMFFAARGYMSPEAELALTSALQRDAFNPRARYYSGIALAQNGQAQTAMETWAGLLEEGPPDAPWIPAVITQIQRLSEATGLIAPEAALSGPSAADIEAAQDMSAEDRNEMIRGMVGGLAERLATEGGPAEEWARLIRSLGVLGELDQAKDIFKEATTIFAEDPEALRIVQAAGEPLGLTE